MISRIIIVAGLIAVAQGTFLRCGPNEDISLCPTCSDKCSDMDQPCSPRTLTNFRCVCRSGYKRDQKGGCVPKENCCTKPNEKYSENGETDRTCDDVLNSRTIFPPTKKAKCICAKGTVRDGNQNCVPESQCYPKCDGVNEVWKKKGFDQKCDGGSSSMGSGCYCKDGYFRKENNGRGECVLKEKCCTKPNEIFCLPGAIDRTCDDVLYANISHPIKPVKCICAQGTVRDSNRNCVAESQCYPICDGVNEVWKKYGSEQKCDGGSSSMGSGCYCKDGYVRKENNGRGECVLKEKCCTKPNEVFSELGAIDRTCDDVLYANISHPTKPAKCICAQGTVRDSNRNCVAESQCYPICDGVNEVWKKYGSEQKCDGGSSSMGSGCYCKDGYVRKENNGRGECVLKEKCCTKPNEVFSELGAIDRTCDDVLYANISHPTKPAKCICAQGTVRDSNRNCVAESQCYPICDGVNEVWKKYGSEQKCDGGSSSMGSGCYCKDGYVRKENNGRGECVLKDKCCTKPNEVFSELGAIDRSCDDVLYANISHPTKPAKCICAQGTVRDSNRNCVAESQCYPICDGVNEVWKKYGSEQKCDGGSSSMLSGCYCKDGYVRKENNGRGECVLKEKCCTKPNEVFSELGAIDRTCDDVLYANISHPTKPAKCICAQGTVRDSNRNCVAESQCYPICDDVNEVWKKYGSEQKCDGGSSSMVSGCYCKDGYFRKENNGRGECVLQEKCCTKPNEVFSELGAIDRTCDDVLYANISHPTKRAKCICAQGTVRDSNRNCVAESQCYPICGGVNEVWKKYGSEQKCDGGSSSMGSGCYCKDGYVRKENNGRGECVLKEKCCTKPNEVFSELGAIDRTCDDVLYANISHPTKPAKCICAQGTVRDSNRNCVAESQCYPICDGVNEVWKKYGSEQKCDGGSSSMGSGCYCKDGYFRKENNGRGECVLQEKCCTKPNEVFSELGAIDRTCDDVLYANTSLPIKLAKCICAQGTVRDSNRNCVAESQCYPICDGENEVWKKYGSEQNCDGGSSSMGSGCYCKDGYFRKENNGRGECVLKEKCCIKPNEIFSELGAIDRTCDDVLYANTSLPIKPAKCICAQSTVRDSNRNCVAESQCYPICDGENEVWKKYGSEQKCDGGSSSMVSGCYCKDGYFRKENNGRGECVLQEKCCTEPNEVFSELGAIDRTCDDVLYANTSLPIKPAKCICAQGTVRDSNRNCVAESQCYPICDGENEVWKKYGSEQNCDGGSSLMGSGCYCKDGYFRKENNGRGECVLKKKCCTKPNEIFSELGAIDRTCDNILYGNVSLPIKPAKCICVKGTVRDSNQNCVPKSQCYPTCDGVNEVWKKKGCEQKCNLNGDDPVESSSMGSGCYCKDGHFRNEKDGRCVIKSECECPGDNECYIAIGGSETDCMDNSSSYCGLPRCYCDDGYKRQIYKDGTYGTCVKSEDCTCDS